MSFAFPILSSFVAVTLLLLARIYAAPAMISGLSAHRIFKRYVRDARPTRATEISAACLGAGNSD